MKRSWSMRGWCGVAYFSPRTTAAPSSYLQQDRPSPLHGGGSFARPWDRSLIVIVESRLEDAAGRVVASHLTALAIGVSRRTLRHAVPGAVTAVLRDLSPAAMVSLDPSYTAWRLDRHA